MAVNAIELILRARDEATAVVQGVVARARALPAPEPIVLRATDQITTAAQSATRAVAGLRDREVALTAQDQVTPLIRGVQQQIAGVRVPPIPVTARDEASATIRAIARTPVPRVEVTVDLRDQATPQMQALTRTLASLSRTAVRLEAVDGISAPVQQAVRALGLLHDRRVTLHAVSDIPAEAARAAAAVGALRDRSVSLEATNGIPAAVEQAQRLLRGLQGAAVALTARDEATPRVRALQQALQALGRHEVTVAARDEATALFRRVRGELQALSGRTIVLAGEDRVTPVAQRVRQALTGVAVPPVVLTARDEVTARVRAIQQTLQTIPRREVTIAARDEATERFRAITRGLQPRPVEIPVTVRDEATQRLRTIQREIATQAATPVVAPAVRAPGVALPTPTPQQPQAPAAARGAAAAAATLPAVTLPGVQDIGRQIDQLRERIGNLRQSFAGVTAGGLAAIPPVVQDVANGIRTAVQVTGNLGRAMLGLSGAGGVLTIAALGAAFHQLSNVLEQDIAKVSAFNAALRSLDAGPVVAALQQANAEVEKLGELATRVQRGGFGGVLARAQGGTQWLLEALGLSTPPEELAKRAQEQARVVLQVREGIAARGTEAARLAQQRASLGVDLQQALGAGNTLGAAAIRGQIEDLAAAQRALERSKFIAEQAAQRPAGIAPTPARLDLEARELAKFDEQTALDKKQRDAEIRQQEEAAAQNRLQHTLRQIEAEKDLDVARAQNAARRAAAEAQVGGTVEQQVAIQLAGIARVRDAEVRAITDAANARARAARGPTREEDVLAIRREEQQQQALLAQRVEGQITDIVTRAVEERRQLQERLFSVQVTLGERSLQQELARHQAAARSAQVGSAAQIQALERVAAVQTQLRAQLEALIESTIQRAEAAQSAGTSIPGRAGEVTQGVRASDLTLAQFDLDERIRRAQVARDVFQQGGTVTPQELREVLAVPTLQSQAQVNPFDDFRLGANRQVRDLESAGSRPAGQRIRAAVNEAGELSLEDDFEQGERAAKALTDQVERLVTVMKEAKGVAPDIARGVYEALGDLLRMKGLQHGVLQ
jgi:hypothetical protein